MAVVDKFDQLREFLETAERVPLPADVMLDRYIHNVECLSLESVGADLDLNAAESQLVKRDVDVARLGKPKAVPDRKTMLQVILSAHIMMQFALDLRKGSSTVFTSIFLSTVAVVDLLGQFDVVAYKHTARN
ncbi:MAG: hypothetical protein LQ347_001958 [Umbilicaria vellea]|nr:MAG: hypothetical protein LQ347_001958 [Umbilicaria vellea]